MVTSCYVILCEVRSGNIRIVQDISGYIVLGQVISDIMLVPVISA
jgi:hypothetical protein